MPTSIPESNQTATQTIEFSKVFDEEIGAVQESRKLRIKEYQELPNEKVKSSLIGLAFSGGGIRSATFNLGILQAFAEKHLLRNFDYLSTVSGGGYIGSWLTALTWRMKDINVDERSDDTKFGNVERVLAPSMYDPKNRNEATSLHWLRMYSNYLTPNISLFSGDWWALAGTWVRNVFLNQLIIGTVVAGLLLFLQAALLFLVNPIGSPSMYIIAGALFLAVASIFMVVGVTDRSSSDDAIAKWYKRADVKVIGTIVFPFVLAAVFLNQGLWLWDKLADSRWWHWWAGGGVFYLVVWCIGLSVYKIRNREADKNAAQETANTQKKKDAIPDEVKSLGKILFFSTLAGAMGASILNGYRFALTHVSQAVYQRPDWTSADWAIATFGSAAVMIAVLITGILHIGLVGRDVHDMVREWWARMGGYLALITLAWLLMTGICVYGPLLVWMIIFKIGWGTGASAAFLWIVNNYLGVKAASSEKTSGNEEKAVSKSESDEQKATKRTTAKIVEFLKSPKLLNVVARVAPYVFAAGLLLLLTMTVHIVIGLCTNFDTARAFWHIGNGSTLDSYATYWTIEKCANPLALFLTGLLLLLAGLGLSFRVDVNDFSIHHFYLNRLVRCYLGASNPKRLPRDFIGFAPNDDLPLCSFAEKSFPGPYPILNAALNLTSGDALGYSTRRAKSFMFTPRYCGYVRHTLGQEDFRFKLDDGYDETYAPTSTGRSEGAEGITLGTAMAVSGAALSPNSGSYSSRGTAFFMTLFDVRLGLWMGNTWKEKDKKWRSYGPGWGISYLLSELFGQSDQFKSFVYLSDGGHFEDLGVYELLKRRCKVIVACDVSCDPEYEFDALLRLIEAARTDFNARIEIKTDSIQPNSGQSEDSVVEGTIFYDPRDERDGKNAGEVGKLIYIKACTSKDLPNDVRRYAKLHASFPQQSTADQWFDEDQFESYRALGECIGKAAVRRIEKSIEDVQSSTRVEYFDYVV